jgi:hypothetical protein
MPQAKPFAFDLDGPLDLYGCGWCGSAEIEPLGATDLRCRNCLETTTPERWCEWCNDHGIEPELGPFLQAVKNVKVLAGLAFDFGRARARYSGEDKADVREVAPARYRELREEYNRLRSRGFRIPDIGLTLKDL